MVSLLIRDNHYNHYLLESARVTGKEIRELEHYGFVILGIYGSCSLGFGNNTFRPFLDDIKSKLSGTQGVLGF